MRPMLQIVLETALIVLLIPSSAAHAQAPPADFKFSATVGGSAPWQEKASVTIDNAGQAHYARYVTGDNPAILAESSFTVSMAGLEQLWRTIQDSSFFTLPPKTDSTAQDGEFAQVSVTAGGASHQAVIRNAPDPRLEQILTTLNAIIPASLKLSYSPPGSFNIVPIDPCATPSGSPGIRPPTEGFGIPRPADPKTKSWFDSRTAASTTFVRRTRSIAADVDLPHAGTVVAYNIPLQDAVRKKIAKLSSKGEFFGDGVSITVDNTKTPPSNTISITLYLEFYGPDATQANIDKIEFDIAKKWSGLKTSSGKTIDLGFVTRANVNASSPPATPGYHEIKLVPKGSARSVVTGGPKVNEGAGGGTWALDEPAGTYGHEAGHLMGLPDRYVDYNKQADGTWKNAKTNQSYANDDAFANYVVSKNSALNLTTTKNFLKSVDVYSLPVDGSENDLMAVVAKPPRQSDIDQIAGNPGVLVTVPPGSVLVNRNGNDQNLVVTRRDDLFVKPGEKRTQNGIYGACIDHTKDIPHKNGMFDVAPPLVAWQGVAAAGHLARLASYIDSAGLFCGNSFVVQDAIWRISDNAIPLFSTATEELLRNAGIDLTGEILDFPRLTPGPSSDTSSSQPFIPDELFVANIHPRFASGQVGSPVTLSAGVSIPLDGGTTPQYAWAATGPDGAPFAVTSADSTASLTPQRSGIYELALKFSFADSLYGPRSFASDRKAFVIVPDANTETFEHSSLADRFPWKSMGDVPWTISRTSVQTGSVAAQAGSVTFGQQSTLAITVVLPADSAIRFSVRTAIAGFGLLTFSIDSVWTDSYSGLADWRVVRHGLSAGRHLLAWSYSGSGSDTTSSVWLDNIFFPGNVVVTSAAGEKTTVPLAFELEQNYPNPFNPATLIRYGLPHRSQVNLSVYTALGQKVAELVHGTQEAGYHEVAFDGSKLSSGVYFYTLRADAFIQTRKLLLVK